MNITSTGLSLIKSFEGCKLTAYKVQASDKNWTIGWGHCGGDVKQGMTITQAEADAILTQDIKGAVSAVNRFQTVYCFNQNEFDSLVSFAYNVGSIEQLTANGTRTRAEIRAALPKYVKSGGVTLAGLVRRRAAELELFNREMESEKTLSEDVRTCACFTCKKLRELFSL